MDGPFGVKGSKNGLGVEDAPFSFGSFLDPMKLDLLPKPWKNKPKKRPHPNHSSTTPSEPATPNDVAEAANKKKNANANAIIVSDDESDDYEILGNGEKKTLPGDTKITAENF